MKTISIATVTSRVLALQEAGPPCTLLGVGPMSKTCVAAALRVSCQRSFPLMLIASRNQVDGDAVGGGYVHGWDQGRFVADVIKIKNALGCDGLLYFCRDHGGPWQRDEERRAALDPATAMAIAKASYLADLESGFHLFHIDPTKDPTLEGPLPIGTVLDRTVELIAFLEQERAKRGLPPVAYEVGTEETDGGLTSPHMFTFFLEELFRRLDAGKLPHPSFIVGQTGTLTRLTENVGRFDKDAARQLARAAAQRGVGLKEHNADYLPDSMLLGHPRWGITAANVAPEFGCVETKAYLDLAALEQQEYGPAASSLGAVLRDEAIRTQRWRKWMVGDWAAEQDLDKVRRDEGVSRQITLTCGHYTFGAEAFRREFAKLSGNLEALGICPEQYALGKVMAAMDRYALCLGLCGLTGKLLGEPPMS